MANAIIGYSISESNPEYETLVSLIYDIIHFNEEDSGKKFKEAINIQIYKLYLTFSRISNDKIHITGALLKKSNRFMLNVYRGTTIDYLKRLNIEENHDLIKGIMGVKNPALMYFFKVIAWVKKDDDRSFEVIRPHLDILFQQGNLDVDELAVDHETMKELFIFFKAFLQGDVLYLLEFLWKLKMVEVYTYILSTYMYTAIISGWVPDDVYDKDEKRENLAVILCYPMIHLVYHSIKKKNKREGKSTKNKNAEIVKTLGMRVTELENLISSSKMHRIIEDIEEREVSDDFTLDLLMTGKLFNPIEKDLTAKLKDLIKTDASESTRHTKLDRAFDKIKLLYIFSPKFYESTESHSDYSDNVENLIRSAIALRERWIQVDDDFNNEGTNLHSFKPKELVSKISKACQMLDFKFLNTTKEDEEQVRKIIFPMMIFMFLFLKKVRKNLTKHDNYSKLAILKASLTFVWKMCQTTNENPLDLLGIDSKHKTDFLNEYTGLIYHLKIKRSNEFILGELLRFVKKYIFPVKSNRRMGHWDDLVRSLRLESFLELFDYMEDMTVGREYNDSNKENILNLVIQIVSVYPEFKKSVNDIRNMIKFLQGDLSSIEYFIFKVFFRDDNVRIVTSDYLNGKSV